MGALSRLALVISSLWDGWALYEGVVCQAGGACDVPALELVHPDFLSSQDMKELQRRKGSSFSPSSLHNKVMSVLERGLDAKGDMLILHIGPHDLNAQDTLFYRDLHDLLGKRGRVVFVEPYEPAHKSLLDSILACGFEAYQVSILSAAVCPIGVARSRVQFFTVSDRMIADHPQLLQIGFTMTSFREWSSLNRSHVSWSLQATAAKQGKHMPISDWEVYVDEISVECFTLDELLVKLQVGPADIDVLFLDTEGYDLDVLRHSKMFPLLTPAVVQFEWVNHKGAMEDVLSMMSSLALRGFDVHKPPLSSDVVSTYAKVHRNFDGASPAVGATLFNIWESLGREMAGNKTLSHAARWLLHDALQSWMVNATFYDLANARDIVKNVTLAWDAWRLQEFGGILGRAVGTSEYCVRSSAQELVVVKDDTQKRRQSKGLCTEQNLGKAIQDLKSGGFWTQARELFDYVNGMTFASATEGVDAVCLVRWKSFRETPLLAFPGLESKPFWTDDPRLSNATAALRRHAPIITGELRSRLASGSWVANDAYYFFKRGNTWQSLILYDSQSGWQEGCALFPETCRVLRRDAEERGWLWTLRNPGVGQLFEQVGIYAVEPGSFVPVHSTSESQINIHLGLLGLEGSRLLVGGTEVRWREGEVLAFQDSFDHSIWHNGDSTRFVLIVAALHPGLIHAMNQGALALQEVTNSNYISMCARLSDRPSRPTALRKILGDASESSSARVKSPFAEPVASDDNRICSDVTYRRTSEPPDLKGMLVL